MGFRTTVIFGVKKDYQQKVFDILNKYDLNDVFESGVRTYGWTEYDKTPNIKHTEYYAIFKADDIKWYEGYPYVDEVEGLIYNLINEDEENAFMVCLGEDSIIHGEQGFWWDYVNHVSELQIIDNTDF